MKRILSIAVLLVMVFSCINITTAETETVYTYYDVAKTQWKTKSYYEDSVLREFTEYPIAGSPDVYTYKAWDENGKAISIYTTDGMGNSSNTYYQYNEDNELFRTYVTTDNYDSITSISTGKTVVTNAGGKVVEQGEYTRVNKKDDKGNYLGYTTNRSTKYFDVNGVLQQSETSTYEEDQHYKEISNIWTVTNEKGIVTSSFTSTSVNKYDDKGVFLGSITNNVYKRFSTSGVLEQTETLSQVMDKNNSYTEKTLITDATGKMLEQIDTVFVQKVDENGNPLGSTKSEVTKYFDEKGSLLKTDTLSQEWDKNDDETANRQAVINAQNIMTSSLDKLNTFSNFLPTGYSNKSSMFDKTTGALLASIKIEDGKTYDAFDNIKSEKRTSVNQAGTLIASYVFEKSDKGSVTKTQYFHEDTGKLRKSEETLETYDKDGKSIFATTVRNAAGIVTETVSIADRSSAAQHQEFTETRKFDSVTGALKSIETFDDIRDKSTETIVKNGAGIVLSKVQDTYTKDAKGFDVTETLYSKYDAVSGALLGTSKGVRKQKSEGSQWYNSDVRYDQQGKKVWESESGPLFDANKKVIGSFDFYSSYDKSGNVEWYERTERIDIKNSFGNYAGHIFTTKNQDGKVISQGEQKYLYDAMWNYLGETNTSTDFNLDGSVSSKFTSTYNHISKAYEETRTDAKGKVLNHVTQVNKEDSQNWTIETTRIEDNYSQYTGNLMTTTTTKSRNEKTGAFEENLRKVKASGHLVRVSDISYMYVDEYGYMNYQNHYTDYKYRADGSLKYTIQGLGLIDNYYLDLFMSNNNYGTNPDPSEIIEKTTAASGVLTREYHEVKDLENGWYSEDYSKETKVYNEKTGALKSITTETNDFDPVTQKSTTHSVTVNSGGKLLAEFTTAYEYDVNDQYVYLGRQRVAFNDEGSQIASYTRDVEGKYERTNKTFNEATGSLLISETRKGVVNGAETAEVLTYDAAGNVIRRETEKSGTDNTTSTHTYVNEAFDAAGKLLYRSANTETTKSDGSVVSRWDEVDAAGRVTFSEGVSKLGPDGWTSELVSETRTYYDEDDLFRKEVTEGNKTTVYNDLQQVLTITVKDEYGVSRTTDANGKLLYYSTISDAGDLSEFYANGKPKLIIARDDDDEVRETSFDKDGYINYVSIDHPDRPYNMYYDGNGKVSEVFYNDGAGRAAYYNAVDKQWYRGSGDDKVAIAVPDFADEIDMSDIVTGGKAKPRGVWYPNNTTGTFGIHLRDVRPELTSKWYTVTPIDLSQDGTQSFELVGGNMWIIGQVNVTVEGDKVTVTYDIIKDGIGRTTTKSEYLNIFSDLNSITEEALEGDSKDGKGYVFGDAISIEKDLGGDTNVLLYVRNVATFNTRVYGERYLVRMWENLPERRERRDAMTEMMDPLKEEVTVVTGN